MNNAELLEGHHLDQERRGLLASSIHKRDRFVQLFARHLEPRSLLSATGRDVEQFLDGRTMVARTRYLWLTHLHGFYDWAVREELTTDDPTVRIIRPKYRRGLPRPADAAELQRALESASPRHRCWVLLAAYQGLRCQEIAGLHRDDIREDQGLLRVVKGKGGAERILPLHQDVFAALWALPLVRSGRVFSRPRGGPYSPNAISCEFNRFLHSAGVTASAHQLRHWFATTLYVQTHDIRLTQEMLGHAELSTTAVYTAFDRASAGEAVRAISLGGPGPAPEPGHRPGQLRLLPPA